MLGSLYHSSKYLTQPFQAENGVLLSYTVRICQSSFSNLDRVETRLCVCGKEIISYNPFPTDEMSEASPCSIAVSMKRVPLFLTFTAKIPHTTDIITNHHWWDVSSTRAISPHESLHCGTNSWDHYKLRVNPYLAHISSINRHLFPISA